MVLVTARCSAACIQQTGQTAHMIQHRPLWIVLATAACLHLAGCQNLRQPKAPAASDLSTEIIQGARPAGSDAACWATDETPAVIETVTEYPAPDITTDAAPIDEVRPRQEIITPRETIWFRTPCEAELTDEVITTLQRALAVRGLYSTSPTGQLDRETRAAIRAFQLPRGLNSDQLSLAAARELGIIAVDTGKAPEP